MARTGRRLPRLLGRAAAFAARLRGAGHGGDAAGGAGGLGSSARERDGAGGTRPAWLEGLCRDMPGFDAALAVEQSGFEHWEPLRPEAYRDKDVLDLGCGVGAASALFVERGARFVWGLDPELDHARLAALAAMPRARFTSGLLSAEVFGEQRFDLVYARVVTEHIYDLPRALRTLFALLREGGRFVGLHDNFYGPMGAHDQGMIGPVEGDGDRFESKAAPCWSRPEKCEASQEFRDHYARVFDWHARDWQLTPDDCTRCPYFRRAQVWGHILCRDEYPTLYAGEFFETIRDGGVNKVTPYQLRQFLIEAGFRVVTWSPQRVHNVPPPELLATFSPSDLQTGTILFAAEKSSR